MRGPTERDHDQQRGELHPAVVSPSGRAGRPARHTGPTPRPGARRDQRWRAARMAAHIGWPDARSAMQLMGNADHPVCDMGALESESCPILPRPRNQRISSCAKNAPLRDVSLPRTPSSDSSLCDEVDHRLVDVTSGSGCPQTRLRAEFSSMRSVRRVV
jgi:hypothetical protein